MNLPRPGNHGQSTVAWVMRVLHCQNCGKAGLAVFQATTPGRPTLMRLRRAYRSKSRQSAPLNIASAMERTSLLRGRPTRLPVPIVVLFSASTGETDTDKAGECRDARSVKSRSQLKRWLTGRSVTAPCRGSYLLHSSRFVRPKGAAT